MITVNGEEKPYAGQSLSALLRAEGYDPARVVLELGGKIVPRALYDTTLLAEGDRLEVVSFVGGG